MKAKNGKKRRSGKPATLLISLLLIFGIAISGTLAYIFVSSSLLNNSFRPVTVTSEVSESFSGITKSNSAIHNTGDIYAWIRAALVLTWEDGSGNAVNQNASLADLSITVNSVDWFCGTDGYYYCKTKVAPNGFTPVLINSATVRADSPGYLKGYHMNLQILCEAIQAEPEAAVNNAWSAVHVAGTNLVG